MDLREFLQLFWRYRVLFLVTVATFVVAGFILQLLQPVRFVAEITMNVARSGAKATSDYAYDDFYRLQADERFADTVVRWIESPRIVGDIAREARVSERVSFDADRLSSQVIRIRFMMRDEASAKRVADALFMVLNKETTSLNKDRSEDGWFALVGETPSIADARFGKGRALSMSFFLGIFFGFFAVLFRWYWNGSVNMNGKT
jgi:uncharacterized protein involved in exopolysaccharide biosynthesis